MQQRWKLGCGYVIGTYQDAQTLFAAQVLSDVCLLYTSNIS